MSDLAHYESPWGVLDFQAEAVAYWLVRRSALMTVDTGLGKGHITMAGLALLFEDDEIDHALIVCETNKLHEWIDDFATFTDLDVALYHGTKAKRERLRRDLPQVIVSTYETVKADAAVLQGRKKPLPGPLLAALGDRVAVVWDEMTKLKSRTSGNHKAHKLIADTLRRTGWLAGLTATPVSRGPEDIYNLARVLDPAIAPTVADFERQYVLFRDHKFGYVRQWMNLDAEDHHDPEVTPLAERLSPLVVRKRKTDADVIEQFPEQVEEFTYVDLDRRQRQFYDTVQREFHAVHYIDAPDGSGDKVEIDAMFTVLRQVAGYPQALAASDGAVARKIVDKVGVAGLEALGSAKADRLVEYLTPIVHGQGAQVVVFTFFASQIPLLIDHLGEAEIAAVAYHGQLPQREREIAREQFRQGVPVLVASDAGQKGINLPEASYVVNYELPTTYDGYVQRINRIHRLTSAHPSVTARSFIVRGTVEEGIAGIVLARNDDSDRMLGDRGTGAVTAKQRRQMLQLSRAA